MCSVLCLWRPGEAWPVCLGANRDELATRPWAPPARHWPDRPEVVAGRDLAADGSWLGINDHGVVAAVLNRHGTLGPAAGRRSRGELVLEALDHADAAAAAEALADLDPAAYRPFNLVVADDRDALWLAHRDAVGRTPVAVEPLPVGLSMITAFERNDPADPRIRRFLPRFADAPAPDPAHGPAGWDAWCRLLGDTSHEPGTGAQSAMCFALPSGFGTGSSALIGLRTGGAAVPGVFLFAAGPPDQTPFEAIDLGGTAAVRRGERHVGSHTVRE